VEHWLNQGITGHSRWIELAWLSIAVSLLAILISEVWPRARKEEPYAPQRGTLSGPRRRALNPLLLAGSASLAVAYPSPRCCVFSAPWHFCHQFKPGL